MTRQVFLIDGPWRGEVREECCQPITHVENRHDGNGTYTQHVTTYTVHSLEVFGRLVHFGTCAGELDAAALNSAYWEHLATRLAVRISEPEPPGPPARLPAAAQ